MMSLKGFMFPRSATGRASLLPDTPWHYSGTMLTVEYRTHPERVAELLPGYLEPADEDPGAVAVIWAEWQNCSDDYSEILDPARSQYKEAFVVVRCRYQGNTYSRCVYIWVDTDYAMVRGHYQGYPKKLASIFVSRPIAVGQAGPRLEAGGRFGASVAAYDHKLIHATFEITGESDHAGFVNGHPMIHNRWMPAIEGDGRDSLDELVTMRAYQGEVGRCFTGDFELQLFDSPVEELARLEPLEKISGYWREVAFSWRSGTTLRRNSLPGLE
ncbi:MAG: acetoacetate decarboxylase family protein [Gammaproteobacteria bacterium]|nr:acetoacetate decarboxylase family protein [Gammaproteobacteria bacterium]